MFLRTKPQCCSCFETFNNGELYPRLLKCAHSICNHCAKNPKIVCSECFELSDSFAGQDVAAANVDIEIDYYSLGLVEAFKRKWHTLTMEHKSKKTDSICFECEQNLASKKCIQCKQNYCQQCSTKCHSSRIMGSHEIMNIDDSLVPLVDGYCTQHKQKPFESYCKECKIHLCVDCVSEHSNEHDLANIAKLNKTEKPNKFAQDKVVRELGEKKILLERLLETLSTKEAKEKVGLKDFCDFVQRESSHLHGLIQNMEKTFLYQAASAVNEIVDEIDDYKYEVRKGIQLLEDTMVKFTAAEPPKNIYVKHIVNGTKDNSKMIIERGNELTKRHSNVKMANTGFKKQTKEVQSVFNSNINSSVTKGKQNTIREPTISRNLVRTDHQTPPSTLISGERNKFSNQHSTDTEIRKSKPSKIMQPKHSINGDARSVTNFENVFQQIGGSKMNEKQLTFGQSASSNKKNDWYKILHYKSPLNITIQNNSIEREKQMFQKHLNELSISWANERNPEKDSIYLAHYNGEWHRAKYLDDLNTKSNEKWFRMVDDHRCFIVPANKCKKIEDDAILKKPPYAIWCGLFNVQKDEWSNETSEIVRKIIANKLFKVVFLTRNTNYQTKVDLIFEDNKRFVSLRDALESAGILKPSQQFDKSNRYSSFMNVRKNLVSTTMERHPNLIKPTMNMSTPISILRIASVCEFYCYQLKDGSARARVKNDLNSLYDSSSYEITLAYVPIDDMLYASKIDKNWHRVKVLESKGNGSFSVCLVDEGIMTTVQWTNLFHLKKEFAQTNQFVFKASLFNINDEEDDEDRLTKQFRDLVKSADKCTAEFTDSKASIFIATVTVEIRNKEHNVIELLRNDQNAIAISSAYTVLAKKTQKKIKIKVKHVVSPSEFYVVLNERQEDVEEMHVRIKDHVEGGRTKSKISWNVGERCIVQFGKSEWYRGIILEPKEECIVFLRDIGKMVTANMPQDLREDNMNEIMPGTVMRCHLAYLQPSSIHSWSLTACDKLQTYSFQANEIEIEIPDIDCVSSSVPVILWVSMNKIPCAALEPAKSKWLNVNLRLINHGLAYPTTSDIDAFTPKTSKPCDEKKNHLALIESLVKRYGRNSERSISQTQIKGHGVAVSWPQANTLETKDFVGIPEWVDNDATVYLHTVEQHEEIATMAEYMTKWIKSFGEDQIDNWFPNEICYAKFNGLYHRAEIKHVYKSEHRCMVYFVDYGNSCILENANLSRYILYDETPIMLYKLRLNGIKPKSKSGNWSKGFIETLSQYICHRECYIFVHDSDNSPGSQLPCRIQPKKYSLDAATFLIQHHKAIRIERGNSESDKSTENFSQRSDKNKSPPLKIDHAKIKNLDDLRSGFEFNKVLLPDQRKNDYGKDNDSFQFNHSLVNCDRKQMVVKRIQISNESTLGPDPTIVTITSHFKLMQLNPNQPAFKCRIVYVIDPITVLIKPEYADEEEIDPTLLSSLYINTELNSPCVAFCAQTQSFQRGIIRADRPSKDAMVVMFVNDSLSSEIVPAKKIRKCPGSLLEKPVNLARVLLHGVQPNNRCREQDVRNQLKTEISTNDEYRAKIKEYKNVPEVKFYDGDNNAITTMLVYRKFYKKIQKS